MNELTVDQLKVKAYDANRQIAIWDQQLRQINDEIIKREQAAQMFTETIIPEVVPTEKPKKG